MMLVVFGLVYLTGYYLGLRWSLRAKIWMPYRTFLVVNLWISAMILSNVYFFLTVGAVLRPSVCLPSAVGLASVTMHGVLASRRIGQLKAALPSESSRAAATSAAANAALEALEEGLQDWYRRRAVRDAVPVVAGSHCRCWSHRAECCGDPTEHGATLDAVVAALVAAL